MRRTPIARLRRRSNYCGGPATLGVDRKFRRTIKRRERGGYSSLKGRRRKNAALRRAEGGGGRDLSDAGPGNAMTRRRIFFRHRRRIHGGCVMAVYLHFRGPPARKDHGLVCRGIDFQNLSWRASVRRLVLTRVARVKKSNLRQGCARKAPSTS